MSGAARNLVLCVDDEPGMLEVCEDSLATIPGVQILTAPNAFQAMELLEAHDIDLLLSDIQMPGMSGTELLKKLRESGSEVQVVMMTGFPSLDTAIKALKNGAADYVSKPFHPDDLRQTVTRLLELVNLREENKLLRNRMEGRQYSGDILGVSAEMQMVFDTIERVAPTDVDVLIQGETGTGKELVARAIHRHSNRSAKPFVPINCGAIPENLLEAEFFGYEKGAFTGADGRSIGLLEYASGGSVFLDELVDLPIHMQAKLLRALQERKVRRVGGKEEIDIDIRIISASARNVADAISDGVFREDLYYRLDVVNIHLPPLRSRIDDLDILIEHFVSVYRDDMHKRVEGVGREAMEAMEVYPWPGNVRELQNVLRRAVALTKNDRILLEDLPDYIAELHGGAGHERGGNGYYKLRDAYLSTFDRDYLTKLMRKHGGDVTAATADADVPRGSLYRLLKKHGIDPASYR